MNLPSGQIPPQPGPRARQRVVRCRPVHNPRACSDRKRVRPLSSSPSAYAEISLFALICYLNLIVIVKLAQAEGKIDPIANRLIGNGIICFQ